MRWVGRRQSGHVQDRRGIGGGGLALGGGIGAVIITLVILFLGGDPGSIIGQGTGIPGGGSGSGVATTVAGQSDPMKEFVSVVLADTEDLWTQVFPEEFDRTYCLRPSCSSREACRPDRVSPPRRPGRSTRLPTEGLHRPELL